MQTVEVRSQLVDSLQLDLVGPGCELGDPREALPQEPSKWYLTGFLAPFDSDAKDRLTEDADDEVESAEGGGTDDDNAPDKAPARKSFLPSSMGMSLLVASGTRSLSVTVRWGDYRWQEPEKFELGNEPAARRKDGTWQRTPQESTLTLTLPEETKSPLEEKVPESNGLRVAYSVRAVASDGGETSLPAGTRSVSVFLVNRRQASPDSKKDEGFAFQTQIEVTTQEPLVPRPNVRSLASDEWDERVADLQFRDVCEYGVGHNVATDAVLDDKCDCRRVRTCWIPTAQVERVAPSEIQGVEISMDALAGMATAADAANGLNDLVTGYESWIKQQRKIVAKLPKRRADVATELLDRAGHAARRIADGIKVLEAPQCLEAFRIANRVMATAARQRMGVMAGMSGEQAQKEVTPLWRPFQLAFLLMNLRGIADPFHGDRTTVDLLFFPTGGGKTEAYLGLAAFALVLRRMRNPGISSAGLTVLMRYTLRLLTLDQLGRGATLICALELERENDVEKLGTWPFEIGLWVGKGATPNSMGRLNDGKQDTARAKTIAFANQPQYKPSPIPLEECPWCGTKFKPESGEAASGVSPFTLSPNRNEPLDLHVRCRSRKCEFNSKRILPIVAVDEPIYRRLPCFMIATVDKFAAMPWIGEVGKFFGRAERYDQNGFYGPCDQPGGKALPGGHLLPPDLIIQDELHLISGPLGTIAGLYEAALEELCRRETDGKTVRPKIVASTATVRRAESQIRALFNRSTVDVFPPPGPDRRHSFFAETRSPDREPARLYVGLAAQGRSPKVMMLRAYLALLGAAQKVWVAAGGSENAANPADPYMTLLGYFNSLRELGGSRRIVEDEVGPQLTGYSQRRRVGEEDSLFADRIIAYEAVELTSRVSTGDVARAKRRLQQGFDKKEFVDVALATNMISVGLDILRLGLMVVFGQPKTSAEYIQATSRVGRDRDKPGLVVTLLNVNRPRDRSHYERFGAYHDSFYRSVEATSVTPFSPRALDRGLAAAVVALSRQGERGMTAPRGAAEILRLRESLAWVVDYLAKRAAAHLSSRTPEAERRRFHDTVHDRATRLFDEWCKILLEYQETGTALQYNRYEAGGAKPLLYTFLDPELKKLPKRHGLFRANRSMRDVEPSVDLRLKTLDGFDIEANE